MNESGERRLNVLLSRAKRRCKVFSSLTTEDVDLARASGRGVAAFKASLEFAATGRLAAGPALDKNGASLLEQTVRKAVELAAYEVHPKVGVAGFFVDLAVVEPSNPGRYLLGIEGDGATYHAPRSALDRDRLRQSVLEDHGWILHRVWSMGWFQPPQEQLSKVTEAIARATKAALAAERESAVATFEAPPGGAVAEADGEEIDRESADDAAGGQPRSLGGVLPYQVARFEVPQGVQPHEMDTKELAGVVIRVVEIEGPVHEDELVNRIRDLWGLGQAGARIHNAVAISVRSVLVPRRCLRKDGFLSLPGAAVPIRNRAAVESATLRKPEMLPPVEIPAAILAVIDAGHGAAAQEIPTAVARMLGFKSTSSQLRAAIEAGRAAMVREGLFQGSNGMLWSDQGTV